MTKKVDTFMEIFHKVISVITVLACVAGLAWSCTNDGDLSAHADEIDILTSIFAYEDDFREGLIDANRACNDAMNDSSLSDEDKAKIRAVLALQELALRTMPDIYGNPTNPILPDSDTVTISGSGTSGIYRSYKDNEIHNVNYFPPSTFSRTPEFSISVFVSDEFDLKFTAISPNWNWTISPYYQSSNDRYGIRIQVPMYQGMYARPSYTFSDSDGYFYTYTMNSTNISYDESKFMCIGRNQIPTLSQNTLWYAMQYNSNDYIGGYGVSVSLPETTTDTDAPWNYYNDTLLPYMHNNYPSVNNNYYVFPNGYYPAQDPTEPPLPDGGMTVNNNWNFNIGINSITVTDASGQPVTDASGETVTETVIETETRPSDAVYHFQIPTLTPLETQVATIPPYQVPSEYAGYMSDTFTAITDFIDDAGLSSIAPVFLALAGIGLVIGVLL